MNKYKSTKDEKKNAVRYKVIATGKIIKVVNVSHGTFKDIRTGKLYLYDKINYLGERSHDIQLGFHVWKMGLYLYAREYIKYNQWYVIPGVSIDAINGYDRYLDIEVKVLFIGLGIRFIWIKRKLKGGGIYRKIWNNNDLKKVKLIVSKQ